MLKVSIDTDKIDSWQSFHEVFKTAFGFPEFYGCNMNAWIDCMTYIDDPGAGMKRNAIAPGDTLVIELVSGGSFKVRCPEIYLALLECTAFVNQRKIDSKENSMIAIATY